MSAEENKALVRRLLEERIKGNLGAVNELLAPDFVDFVERSMLPDQELSREEYKRSMVDIASAFSFADLTIEDQIAEGDKVVTRWTGRCTHNRGRFMGMPPTGMEGLYTGVEIHRISEGKIAEEWSESDFSGLMRQRLEQEMRVRERVEEDLRVARSIQQASLPKTVPTLEGWQLAAYYKPAWEVGGDFYDFLDLPDERLGLVVGDATGHGISAALVMATTRSMLRIAAQISDSPGAVLAQVNDVLYPNIPSNMFVTCLYAILDPTEARLRCANAGHNLLCLRHHGEGANELRVRGMPLGLMPGMGYEEKETSLREGDSILFYSDGLVEAHDPKGEMFGFPRLQDLLALHNAGDSAELIDFLLAELERFTGEGWEQEDDITLLTLERSAQ